MTTKKKRTSRRSAGIGRRRFLLSSSAVAGAAAFPHIWIPGRARASTSGFNTAKHFLYFRLSGGFRFTTCFNADVAQEFNPFGTASSVAEGTEWGVGSLLADDGWLTPELQTAGLSSVTSLTSDMTVLPCVDHEPLAGSADGNHGTGLERFLTGYVNGETGLFTMINYGLKSRYEAASDSGNVILPAI
ncbi:MAG: transcriptional initiation protein Tat, partial [Nannocystaceae bacterium]